MEITIHIYYYGKDNAAKQFALEMISSGIVLEIRQKEGNLQYDYFLPFEENGTVLLIDRWKNQHALDEHHQSETMLKILKLREKYHLTMKVERLINDPQGIPHTDTLFIKNID